MRIILCFDLSMETNEEKREYDKFRKNIMKNGYTMMQFSVYVKCINSQSKYEQEVNKIKKFLPTTGNVRMFAITEKQYDNMKFLLGSKTNDEIYNDQRRYVKI
ncbi:CRISPR-associated endonuclease Cas2 [Ureaplasma ceti]|uniref:CRISPR-associated endoribonuclease Cas2 n=1 Tax=Ureaplasma ceti TaxID=3119530 RepID=A0ABP9UA93_9BACT